MKPHAVFERNGGDLQTKVAVPVTTAVLGGEAQVPTVTGSVRLKIPEGTQNGQVFRLKGHGMPNIGKPDDRGDLYATVEVQLPAGADQGATAALRGVAGASTRTSGDARS